MKVEMELHPNFVNVLDRNLSEEVVEGFDHLAKERQWVELSDEDQDEIFEEWHSENKGSRDLCDMVEAKLKELNICKPD